MVKEKAINQGFEVFFVLFLQHQGFYFLEPQKRKLGQSRDPSYKHD